MKDKWIYNQYIDFIDPDYTSYNLLTTRDYRYQDSGNWKDLLTYYFGSTITYDDIGNPLNYRNGMTMTWVNGRRLASVTNSGVTTAYTYNDDGIRLTKQVGSNPVVTYETDGGKVLCQRTRIGTNDVYVYFFYDESGNAYAMKYNGDMYYYLRNGQNDIIGIIDDTGAVVARYTYDPWGKPLSVTDGAGNTIAANATHIANANPFRYRGYFYDTETGFYYLQSRYYDPVTGRFINADGQLNADSILGFNLFAYCENNPVNMSDPSGCVPMWMHNFGNGVVGYTDAGTSRTAQKTPLSVVTANEIISYRKYIEMLAMVNNDCTTMTQDDYDDYSKELKLGVSPYLEKTINKDTPLEEKIETNNCAYYAALMYYKAHGRMFSKSWRGNDGISQTPRAGSIAYYTNTPHYVFVHFVYGDVIFFSDANWHESTDFHYQMLTLDKFIKRGHKDFQGFMY